ncbi:MAG: acyl-CoA thioesterase [Planctomycetes bacterium]|nr:acyl-CoA thioesterase [Planctomycetota bacterium]
MFYRFVANVPLRWVDVDSEGVVNNAVYLSLMEQARYLYFTHLGLLEGHNVPFLLAEANVKFLRPGRIDMKVEVAARVGSLGTTSFQMDYEVRAAEEVLATGHAALVWVDASMRPVPIPGEVRAAIEQFEELRSAR